MWNPSPWREQSGSFQNPVTPPTSQPCDGPLVCFSVNAEWLPLIVGSLLQLVQPTTWDVSTETDLLDILARAQDLIDCVGTAMPCVPEAPILPGVSTAQGACNISGYLANVVIKSSMEKAIQAIQDGQTIIGYGQQIISLIPGAGEIVNLLINGLADLYNTINGGTLSDYQEAVNDPTLWGKITCAIYSAISADGQVRDTNYAALRANVAAVSYTHSDVISAISGYLSDLGPTAVANLQATGALAEYDCSLCGTGVSTGPAGLPPRQQAGRAAITIASGSASATVDIALSAGWAVAPVVTVNSENPDLIASASAITISGFTLTLTAAVPVGSTTVSAIDWLAVLPGGA